MEEKERETKLRCDNCQGEIYFGRDVIRVEKCVRGPRGIIPLGETLTFCSEDCVSRHFDHEPASDLPEVPRRIP